MKSCLKNGWQLFVDVIMGYHKDDCYNFAAVISFYAIFSLLPLAMIIISVLAYLLGSSSELIGRFQAIFDSVMPTVANELMLVVKSAVDKKQRFSYISAAMLFLVASFLVTSLETALDRVFRTEKKRNFFHSRIVAIGFIFVFILLFAAPGVIALLQDVLIRGGLMNKTEVITVSGNLFFFFIAFGGFFLSTTVIPNKKVYMRFSFLGALIFTVLTGVARLLFRQYIGVTWSRYDLIYGSVTVMIVILLWVYYMASIYLLSSEFVARIQERYHPKVTDSG